MLDLSPGPRGLLAFIAGVSFAIGVAFALYGASPILPFVGLEVAARAAAFYVNGRHATDYERVALVDSALVVEIRDGDRTEEHSFNPHWVRLVVSGARRRRCAGGSPRQSDKDEREAGPGIRRLRTETGS